MKKHSGLSEKNYKPKYTPKFLGCLQSLVDLFDVQSEDKRGSFVDLLDVQSEAKRGSKGDLLGVSSGNKREYLTGFLARLKSFAAKYVRRGQERNALIFRWEQEDQFARSFQTVLDEAGRSEYLKKSLIDRTLGCGELGAGKVAFYPIHKREILARSHIYVMGLSAKCFTVKETESAVLSDAEIKICLASPTESGKHKEQQKRYELAASLASVKKGRLTFSYAGYDTVEMYPASPSVFFIEALAYAGKESEEVREISYGDFRKALPETNVQGEELRILEHQEITWRSLCEQVYSVTSMQEMLACPKKFYYHHVLGIEEPDYHEYQPGKWLKANEKGNLVHSVLENYVNRVLVRQEAEGQENIFKRKLLYSGLSINLRIQSLDLKIWS